MTDALINLFSLKNRVALVTGGTSGIGYMMAKGLLLAGAEVHIVGRHPDRVAQKAKELSAFGHCLPVSAELSDEMSVNGLIDHVKNKIPSLNVLVNNAGITRHGKFGEFPTRHWDEVLGLNLKTPYMLIEGLYDLLRGNASQQTPAHILNTGSVAGLIARTNDSYSYGPSKAALHHMTKVLAHQSAKDHICINAIAPGLFPSEMSSWIVDDESISKAVLSTIPLGRAGEERDLMQLIISIVSNAYATGGIFQIDGGAAL